MCRLKVKRKPGWHRTPRSCPISLLRFEDSENIANRYSKSKASPRCASTAGPSSRIAPRSIMKVILWRRRAATRVKRASRNWLWRLAGSISRATNIKGYALKLDAGCGSSSSQSTKGSGSRKVTKRSISVGVHWLILVAWRGPKWSAILRSRWRAKPRTYYERGRAAQQPRLKLTRRARQRTPNSSRLRRMTEPSLQPIRSSIKT